METSKKLIGQQLSDQTLFAVDTHANHLAPQANGAEQMTLDICGLGSEMPLAHYDQPTQSWRTSEDISLWGDYKLLENLPKSGMTRSGVLYQQPVWVRLIDETELLSWPTPTAVTRPMEGNVRMYRAKIKAGEMTEAEAEAILGKSVWEAQGKIPTIWPTPTTQEVEHPNAELTQTGRRKSKNGQTSHSLGLADAVQMWPTPTAHPDNSNLKGKFKNPTLGDAVRMWPTARASAAMADSPESIQRNLVKKGYKSKLEQTVQLRQTLQPTGKLNPMWVEWLMGFPLGWTDLED